MENKINKKTYSLYKQYLAKYFRISSYPFISGDTFRSYSKHVFDEQSSFVPENVANKDLVFVKSDMLERYFKEIHPQINNKYVLLSHNSDDSICSDFNDFIDSNIIHWFAQNLVEDFSEKVSILPIGLENRWYFNNGKIGILKKFAKHNTKKNLLALSLFNPTTNSKRIELSNIIKNNDLITKPEIKNKAEYLDYVSRSKFVLCPEGNGPDTHRIWESLLFESIPIMNKSSFSNILKKAGIPIYILKNWKEINNLNYDLLNANYEKNKLSFESNKFTHFSYWEDKINQHLDG